MNTRFSKSLPVLVVLVLSLGAVSFGCKQQGRTGFAILSKRGEYEQWLTQQRPVLAGLPKAIIFEYDFKAWADGSEVRPLISYRLKAGDWDGILELWFVLTLDGTGHPNGMREEKVTFIRLPAKRSVVGEEGKKRNEYSGFKLAPNDAHAALKRVVAGGDFNDFCKQADESGQFICSLFDYNDPWKKLRTQ